jgi:hypothetical protein
VRLAWRAVDRLSGSPLIRRIDRHGQLNDRLDVDAVSTIVRGAVREALKVPAD